MATYSGRISNKIHLDKIQFGSCLLDKLEKNKTSYLYPSKSKKISKYNTHISNSLMSGHIQLIISIGFIFHFFPIMHQQKPSLNYFYGFYIMSHIFAYTSLMDKNKYAILLEFFKIFFTLLIIYVQNFSWFGLSSLSIYLICFYIIISMLLTIYFSHENKTIMKPA